MNPRGAIVARAMRPVPLNAPTPLVAEQRADDWWAVVNAALRECLGGSAHLGDRVRAVAVTSHLEAWVPLDDRGAVLGPGLTWLDRQTVGLVEGRVGEGERRRAVTGVPLDFNSPTARMAWFQEADPAAYGRTRWFLSPKDFVNFRLCGVPAADPTMASKTGLLPLGADHWDEVFIRKIDLDPARLPVIVESSQAIGSLTAEAARETGLAEGTPVIAGCGDDYSQALGAGAVEPGELNIGTGTGSAWKGLVDRPVVAAHPELETHRFLWPDRWVLWTGIHATGYSARWLAEVWGLTEEERVRLDAWVASAEPGSEGLFFYPHLWGCRLPRTNPYASAVFFGATHRHRREHFYQALLEAAALLSLAAWQVYADAGFIPSRVTMVGGETTNDVWNQVKADALGIPIAVPVFPGGAPVDASAFGAALLAGVGSGSFRDPAAAVRATLSEVKTFSPRPHRTGRYRELFQRYLDVYRHLEAAYATDWRHRQAAAARRREPS
jgi:xylulokinase